MRGGCERRCLKARSHQYRQYEGHDDVTSAMSVLINDLRENGSDFGGSVSVPDELSMKGSENCPY